MATDWDDILPQWRKEGRTGPGAGAPRYAKGSDRAKVRRGEKVTNSNPGGPGGSRRKIQTNKPQGKTSHRAGGGGGGKKPDASSFVAEDPKMAYALVAYFALIVASPFAAIGGIVWAVA